MKLRTAALGVALAFLFSAPASAGPTFSHVSLSLTPSERAQIKGYYAASAITQVPRVRALVARPDLSQDEAAAALAEAFVDAPWNDTRAAFVSELVFGPSSASSRSALVPAVVKAVLQRVDAVLVKSGSIEHTSAPDLAEIRAIYTYIDTRIANAGKPRIDGPDPQNGISPKAYEDSSKLLVAHVSRHAGWAKPATKVSPPVALVRAQAHLTLADLFATATSPQARFELADALGFTGPRRGLLVQRAVLYLDDGTTPDASVEIGRDLVAHLPLEGLGAIVAVDDKATFASRRPVASARPAIETRVTLWGDDIEAGPVDPKSADVVYELSRAAVRSVAQSDPAYARLFEADVKTLAKPFGRAKASDPESAIGGALQLLLTDADRTFVWASIRFLSGQRAPWALVTDALSTLAKAGGKVEVVKATANSGAWSPVDVKAKKDIAITSFAFGGHTWNVERDASQITKVSRDGKPIAIEMFPEARIPLSEGSSWSYGGLAFSKLRGAPKAAMGAGPIARLVATGGRGYDAIATPTPPDYVLEGDLSVNGEVGGVLLRASIDGTKLSGALLALHPTSERTLTLTTLEDAGLEPFMAAPHEAKLPSVVHVKITVRGTKIDADVGGVAVRGTMPANLAKGDLALVAKHGSVVDLSRFAIKPLK